MQDYFETKKKLIERSKNAIINIDDKYSYLYIISNNKNYTYGKKKSNYMIN